MRRSAVLVVVLLAGVAAVAIGAAVVVWPMVRPPSRPAEVVAADWAEVRAWMPDTLAAPAPTPAALATFADVPWFEPGDPPDPEGMEASRDRTDVAVVARVLAWIEADGTLPVDRCELLLPPGAPHVRPFDVYNACQHLVAAGHPDEAVALCGQYAGAGLVQHAIALGVAAAAVEAGVSEPDRLPRPEDLFRALATDGRCADAVIDRLSEDPGFFAREEIASANLLDLRRDQRALRTYYADLLRELHPVRHDADAMASRLAGFRLEDHEVASTVVGRLLVVGTLSAARDSAALHRDLAR